MVLSLVAMSSSFSNDPKINPDNNLRSSGVDPSSPSKKSASSNEKKHLIHDRKGQEGKQKQNVLNIKSRKKMFNITEGILFEFEVANLDTTTQEKSSGKFVVWTRPSWSPLGVKRFEQLSEDKYWEGCFVFRVIPKFVAQFGINPRLSKRYAPIEDEPFPTDKRISNSRGTITFAMSGTNTRSTQVYVNTKKQGNAYLDKEGFLPFGKVVKGMEVVDQFYEGYGETKQGLFWSKGNEYLKEKFPKMAYITAVKMLEVEDLDFSGIDTDVFAS